MNDEPTLFDAIAPQPKAVRKPRTPKAPKVSEPQPGPIPKRLYFSDGLAFELHDGGRPEPQLSPIRWERLKPVQRVSADKETRTK